MSPDIIVIVTSFTVDKMFEINTFFENRTEIRTFFENRTEICILFENRFEIYSCILFEIFDILPMVDELNIVQIIVQTFFALVNTHCK